MKQASFLRRHTRPPISSRLAPVAICLLVLLASAPVAAHEFWLAPERFFTAPGELIGIRLLVGDGLALGEVLPRDPAHVRTFTVSRLRNGDRRGILGGSNHQGVVHSHPVPGRTASDPAGVVRAPDDGAVVVAYTSNPTRVVLSAKKFEEYLEEEGLGYISQRRRELGQTSEPGREAFSRCAKTVVRSQESPRYGTADRNDSDVGASGTRPSIVTTPLGLELELVPNRDPSLLAAGDLLQVQLLHRGQPVQGAQLVVFHDSLGRLHSAPPTDADGRSQVRLESAGSWLVSSIVMEEAPASGSLKEVDWNSTWTSLTFQVGDPEATASR